MSVYQYIYLLDQYQAGGALQGAVSGDRGITITTGSTCHRKITINTSCDQKIHLQLEAFKKSQQICLPLKKSQLTQFYISRSD